MAKGTETLKENRKILAEMQDMVKRYNQGLKDGDRFSQKMAKNNAKALETLIKTRKQNGMNAKQLGKAADLGKEIAEGNIDIVKSKRLQNNLEKKLSAAKTKGQKNSIKAQMNMLKGRDQAEKVQKRTNFLMDSADKLTGGMASKTKNLFGHVKKVGPGFAAAGFAVTGIVAGVALIVKSLRFVSDLTDKFGAKFGVIGAQSSEFQTSLMDASVEVISLGKGADDVAEVVGTLSSEFGIGLQNATNITEQILDTAVATGMATGEATKLFGTLMTIGNLTADQAEFLTESTYQLAAQNRVNPAAVMQDIAASAETIAKFGADNLDSISKAAVKARVLGTNLSSITSGTNPYVAANKGKLDTYHWGYDIAQPSTGFTKEDFVTNLEAFWTPGDEECVGDVECLSIYVKDDQGNPIECYTIYVDNKEVGVTDENGFFSYSIPNASTDTKHTVDICHCITTTGGCSQQRVDITVTPEESKHVIICSYKKYIYDT